MSFLSITREPLFYSDQGQTLRILIDSDNSTETGYFIPGMGADHVIEIFGKRAPLSDNATIVSSVLYSFDDGREHNDWNGFVALTNIEAASDGGYTECQVPLFDLGSQSTDAMKVVWQTSDGSGTTDLSEIILGINTANIRISDELAFLQKSGEIPLTDDLVIDGYFGDWKSLAKYLDTDRNEYQENPESVGNSNVDIVEYAGITQDDESFFYLSVEGNMLAGTTIPSSTARATPSFDTNSNPFDIVNPISAPE